MSTSSTSEAKNAEFARLFSLFEHLASRGRPRAKTTATATTNLDTSMDAKSHVNGEGEDDGLHSLPVPEELGPVIKKLSNIVSARHSKPRIASRPSAPRPRRNTVASTTRRASDMTSASENGSSDGEENDQEDVISLAKFPLANEKKFPFTFKHMVHKLYRKDEWAKTIKEMLEKSKNEFKPLAEQEQETVAPSEEVDDGEVEQQDGAIRFKVVTSPGAGRRGSVQIARPGIRERSQSAVNASVRQHLSPSSPLSPGFGYPGGGPTAPPRDIRALKKRCVGRRRSMSGPLNGDGTINCKDEAQSQGRTGSWVYASAISSAERDLPTIYASFPPAPPPSPTQTNFSESRYQPLLGGSGRANLSSGVGNEAASGAKRRASAGYPGCEIPFQLLTNRNTDRRVTRKRALAVDTADEMNDDANEVQGKQMKRPFVA